MLQTYRGPATAVGIDIGCLEGVSEETLATLPITYVDGLHGRQAPPAFFAHL